MKKLMTIPILTLVALMLAGSLAFAGGECSGSKATTAGTTTTGGDIVVQTDTSE